MRTGCGTRGTRRRSVAHAPIYFDLDSDALTDADRASLDAKVGILNASTDVKIRVAGHTDERGSDEYNLALGQRRAAAAKRYLTQHGVPDARIDIISYGEEHPAVRRTRRGRVVEESPR